MCVPRCQLIRQTCMVGARLNYCNSLFFDMSDTNLDRLKRVRNSLTRVAAGTHRRDHIRPVFARLHWLPIRARDAIKSTTRCIQDQTGTSTIVLIGYDQRRQDVVDTSILIPAATKRTDVSNSDWSSLVPICGCQDLEQSFGSNKVDRHSQII